MRPEDETSEPRIYMVVEAESDGVTLKVPSFTLPGLDSITWERFRIHNEVEAMNWPDVLDN